MFSRNTVIELIRAFEFQTHARLDQVALQFGLEDFMGTGGLEKKETSLMKHLIANPDLTGPGGGNIVLELIEFLFQERCSGQGYLSEQRPHEAFPKLINALKHDGYWVDGLKLKRMLPATLPVTEHEDELTQLLKKHRFTTALGHFQQAVGAHTRADWAATNAQLRSFVEELFDRIADVLSGGASVGLASSHARRESLAKNSPPFFSASLNEWEIASKGGFVQGFWKRLHPAGSHPGLSDEEDCTFRMHLVIIVARYFIRRFDAMVSS